MNFGTSDIALLVIAIGVLLILLFGVNITE